MVAPDSKLLKPRNINRLVLLLGFLAPLVYLFGTQFFALAGAHGEMLFAESQQDSLSYDLILTRYSTISDVDGTSSIGSQSQYAFLEYFDVSSYEDCVVSVSSSGVNSITALLYDSSKSYLNYLRFFQQSGSFTITGFSYIRFYVYSQNTVNPSFSLTISGDVVPPAVDASTYRDYLFDNMFGKDNFLADLGRESLKDNPKGFAPYGSLIKFLDDTVFHMSDNSLALMGYGYVYYCGHVVLLDLIALILLFIPRLIAMVLEFVTKGVDTR